MYADKVKQSDIDLGDRVEHKDYGKGVVMGWSNAAHQKKTFFVHFDGDRKQCEADELTLIDKGYFQREIEKIKQIWAHLHGLTQPNKEATK